MNWFAVYTQAQKEHLAARTLKGRGYEVFWPHTTEWTEGASRVNSRLVRRSMFSRYLFVRTTEDQLWGVNDAIGVSCLVYAPGGEPHPIQDWVMQQILALADHTGEVFAGKTIRKKPKYRIGDIIRITDEKSPLFGLYVQAKRVLDNGTVHAMFMGQIAGGSKIILADSSIGEVVQGAA